MSNVDCDQASVSKDVVSDLHTPISRREGDLSALSGSSHESTPECMIDQLEVVNEDLTTFIPFLPMRPEDLLPKPIKEGWVEVIQLLRKSYLVLVAANRKVPRRIIQRSNEETTSEEEGRWA